MDERLAALVRTLCLALPESKEKETWGVPTFRVRTRIFAQVERHNGGAALWCKAPDGAQAALVAVDPGRYFVPHHVGHYGWIGVILDQHTDWDEVAVLVEQSYGLTAPRNRAVRMVLLAGKGGREGALMYFLLLYDVVDDYVERRAALRDDHLNLAAAAHARGELVLAGALADPVDGAVLLFKGDDASVASRFAESDPYVKNGLVTRWRVRPWTVVVGG